MHRAILLVPFLFAAQPVVAQTAADDVLTDETHVSTAEDVTTGPMMTGDYEGVMIRASAVADATVYLLDNAYDEVFWNSGESFSPLNTAWVELGEVEDVILDNNGGVLGVTVEVGGFLGIGDDTVLLPLSEIRLVRLPDDEDLHIVTRLSREAIESLQDIEDEVIGDE